LQPLEHDAYLRNFINMTESSRAWFQSIYRVAFHPLKKLMQTKSVF
jgi:hypothetical protein